MEGVIGGGAAGNGCYITVDFTNRGVVGGWKYTTLTGGNIASDMNVFMVSNTSSTNYDLYIKYGGSAYNGFNLDIKSFWNTFTLVNIEGTVDPRVTPGYTMSWDILATANFVRKSSTGFVGIGNTAPINTLFVQTTGNGNGITISGDTNTRLTFAAKNTGIDRSGSISLKAADGTDKSLQFWNNSTDINSTGDIIYKFLSNATTQLMCITNGGNIGIGTTGPSTKLSVEGASSTTGRNDAGTTLNVNVNDAAYSTNYTNGAPFGINVQQTQNAGYRFCQFNSNYTPNSGGTLDAEFVVYGNGNVTADGTYTSPADYAEMFEWEDGNPDNEDRVGYSVVLSSGNKIRKSESTDPPESLIGVVSGRPAVCADTAWNRWADKYLKDDFNRYLTENYEVWKWTDASGNEISYDFDKIPEGVVVPENKTVIVQERYILNPNYDPDVVYTPRMKRKEWSPIGMVGKLSLLNGQLTGPRWIKLVDFSPTVSQWLIR